MTTVLHIASSGITDGSVSRAATAQIIADLSPTKIITRDLAITPMPQVNSQWINARLVPAEDRSVADTASLALSDILIAEIEAADIVVIGMPIYNFGMPAALKAWVDLIARPGVTFSYTENGPIGLINGKKAIVAVASGGTPIDAPFDFATPHLRQVLRFVGIDDITVHVAKDLLPVAA
ncbi:FMN-dependent NADH-azoreductase [Loktanella sp. D2R18]|uniref:FMN-dependent NADH-azoreductase n=1 Tax=Rhodobacterales TaxID=204455 RepID=UPI000DEA8ED2|nr:MULTISPECIES: NAD(P)H-dependent oxidoreductase [Rhodobacterales]MDO6588788.1 NAD(P)H-dependent oxidoreductase [Yoonia sp. 1_MG-2023]RBW41981.1 FMN-dependent NADH-azoreductase [Loktanella sp. D2R18]